MRKLKNVVLFILMVTMIFAMGNVAYAASASLSPSSSNVKTGETVNITVKVNSTEAWNLSLTASGGSLGGTTNVADAADSEVTQNVMTATFVASTAGSYTIKLSGEVTGSDLNKKTVSESITITVTEPQTEAPVTPQQPTTPQPQTNTQPVPSTQTSPQPQQPQTPKTPTLKNTFKDVNETVYVYNTESVNVRELDSASSTRLGGLSKGTAVTRTGISTDGSWSRVSYNGKTAYISSDYLTKEKPADANTNTVTNEVATNEVTTNTVTNEVSNTIANDVSGTETNEIDDENIDDSGILRLKSLEVKGANISDVFKPYIYEYTINVASSIEKLEIVAEPNIEGATVEIMGNEGLQEGENVITIMLKSEDGQVATYQITANVGGGAEAQDTGFDLMYILYILIALIVIVIIAIIVLKIKMKNSGDYDEEDKNADDIANKYVKGEDFNNSNIFDYDKEFKNDDNDDYVNMPKMKDNTNDYDNNDFMNDGNIDEDDRSSGRRGGKHF